MSPTPQTQFFTAVVLIGGTAYPVMPTPTLNCPKNFIIPPLIGNNWQLNYGEGFRQPTIDLQFAVRDDADGVLSTTFLNLWLTRTDDAAYDTVPIAGGIVFWDGRSGWTLSGAKADALSVSTAKEQPLNFTGRFCGTGLVPLSSKPSFSGWDRSRIITAKNCNMGGALMSKVWMFGMSYSNNHTPDMSINGSEFPAACNAGSPTAGLNLTVQAADIDIVDNADIGLNAPTAITFTAAGDNISRTFSLNNPIDQTKDNRSVQAPRTMRQHSYTCLGVDSATTGPLSIS